MNNLGHLTNFQLIYVIVNHGTGSRVLRKAKEYGLSGGSVFLGRGTVNNPLLNFLSIYDERKEIVLLGTDRQTGERALQELNKEFQFEKPHHGIAFAISTCEIIGSRCYQSEENKERGGIKRAMYQLIMTIVNRGKAREVIEAAQAVGSKGGTIINGRGSGVNETSKLFNMEIEPEKEIVMIISRRDITEAIVSSIREKLAIDQPGQGIIFVQNVEKAYGIYE